MILALKMTVDLLKRYLFVKRSFSWNFTSSGWNNWNFDKVTHRIWEKYRNAGCALKFVNETISNFKKENEKCRIQMASNELKIQSLFIKKEMMQS